MTIHELKIGPLYLQQIKEGVKRFEIRKDDRGFKVGDILRLREWWDEDDIECSGYGPNECMVRIIYRTEFAQQDGYCVLGISNPV